RGAAEPQVVVACLNAPGVTVVAGPETALERVLDTARGRGVRAVRLAVPYLSHHPAMAGADDEWYAMIRRYPRRPLEHPVHSPVRGRAYHDGDDLHRALADCIVKPVRLPQTLRAVRDAGATVFTEAGAGDALCQCARLTLPGVRTLAPLRGRPPAPPPTGPAARPPAPPPTGPAARPAARPAAKPAAAPETESAPESPAKSAPGPAPKPAAEPVPNLSPEPGAGPAANSGADPGANPGGSGARPRA